MTKNIYSKNFFEQDFAHLDASAVTSEQSLKEIGEILEQGDGAFAGWDQTSYCINNQTHHFPRDGKPKDVLHFLKCIIAELVVCAVQHHNLPAITLYKTTDWLSKQIVKSMHADAMQDPIAHNNPQTLHKIPKILDALNFVFHYNTSTPRKAGKINPTQYNSLDTFMSEMAELGFTANNAQSQETHETGPINSAPSIDPTPDPRQEGLHLPGDRAYLVVDRKVTPLGRGHIEPIPLKYGHNAPFL